MDKRIVSIYSILHFVVDLSCAVMAMALMMSELSSDGYIFTAILLYNFFAFVMQFPIGIIADIVNRNAICAGMGCLLVAVSFFCMENAVIACVIAGIGNAMFHVGGGIDVLNISNNKATRSGIFVSTGALGIFGGGQLVTKGFEGFYLIITLLIVSAIILIWLYKEIRGQENNVAVTFPRLPLNGKTAVLCLVLTVCIRSYVGLILLFDWKRNQWLSWAVILAVVLGKMLGGVLGDRFGFCRTSVLSLAISALFFLFSFKNPVLGVMAILLFNMTMPITLTAMSNILVNKGMAFGLLTAALFIGYLVSFSSYSQKIFNPIGLFVITLISAIILCVGIKKYSTYMEDNND